jgi:electron transport complex protein RnfE
MVKFNEIMQKMGKIGFNNNQALVALLGLCPLLAVTNNITNAIGLGLATTFVLVASNTTVSIFI